MYAFSSAYPPDQGIDLALVFFAVVCILAVLYAVDWVRN